MSTEVLPSQDDPAGQEARVFAFPAQRLTAKLERKTNPDFVKIYTDLAKLAFTAGDIETAEQYRQMAELFEL